MRIRLTKKVASSVNQESVNPVAEDSIFRNLKWYQSLVRSFDQEKNNILAQQKKKIVKTSSSSENEPCCSKACKKNTESLNSKITELTDKLFDAKNMIYHYKLGLAQVEARLAEHRDRELKYCEKIRALEFQTESSADCIESIKKELELIKKEKEGYNVVPPPPAQIYSPPKKDMSWTGLPKFADDTITDYSRPSPTIESNIDDTKINSSATKTRESSNIITSKPAIKFVKAVDRSAERPTTDKVETTKKPFVKYAELYQKLQRVLRLAIHRVDRFPTVDLKFSTAAKRVKTATPRLNTTGRNLRANRPTSMAFDMLKVECYNCHRKGHFARECRSLKDTRRNGAAEPQRRNVPAEEEPTNYALMTFTSLSSSSFNNELRDNALVVLRQKFEKAEQEGDDLKLKLEKFQTSLKNVSQLLASQTNDKIGLGYNTQVFTSSMFDCDEMFTSKNDDSLSASPIYDRYHSGDGYHVVSLPYTGTFMPPKPDLVFHDASNVNETVHTAFNVKLSPTKPDKDFFVQPTEQVKTPRSSVKTIETSIPADIHKIAIPMPKSNSNRRNRKACFMLLTKSKLVPITTARPVTAVVPKPHVTRPRQGKPIVTKPHSPPRRTINHSLSPKASTFSPKVTTAKGNPQRALMDKGVIDSGWSRHITWNMSYLSDFEKLNGGYVAFGGNSKGGKISRKGKIMTRQLDFDDVYFVKELKFNLFSVS
uniref:CCHC-type domain-containing protein n=1 Tax=Tanacetum cinerariifolium TaxID=118510 RepID=A0A699GW57_TANCI|nr:hypothetical protein [Tanacetum cinerariifolium]